MRRGMHLGWALPVQQVQVTTSLKSENGMIFSSTYLAQRSCCDKCMARCLSCPLGQQLTGDEVVKAILNLGGENYGSGNRVLILSETCHYSNTLLVYICMYYTLNN